MAIALSQSPPAALYQNHAATWQDYIVLRDESDWRKIAFHQIPTLHTALQKGWLWADMGKEGRNHARFSDLLTMLFGFWAFLHPETPLESFGRCLIEKAETQAAAPDLVLYRGDRIPQWQPGEPRKIDLDRHRIPDLVGEVSDTTLSLDLDEQKRLYASLGIPEYWVIDVVGLRLFAFGLNAQGRYESIEVSQCLLDLSIDLVSQTIGRLAQETSTAAAKWFMEQLQKGETI